MVLSPVAGLERWLEGLGRWLAASELGLGVLALVGLSMALSQGFALLANRLSPRQILVRLLLDALVLNAAFLLGTTLNLLLLGSLASRPVAPSAFLNGMAACFLPGLLYGLVAAPYLSHAIAVTIWGAILLNLVTMAHGRFGLAYGEALLLLSPGYGLALLMVGLQFRQSWRVGYDRLASQLDGPDRPAPTDAGGRGADGPRGAA
ncbi:MAG: hypothetical protein VKO65_06215 [Cyanobacteriota bacterium]|nr:hypothetical protein [Cyanobacteriota bacterium]